MLPDRAPLAAVPQGDELIEVNEGPDGQLLHAVSAFVAPAYVRLYHPAFETRPGAPDLPLFGYSAVGWMNGRLYVPAVRVDSDQRQDPYRFDIEEIERRVTQFKLMHPANQTVKHLEHCALDYHCRAAQNYFLGRWEAPLPAASVCNASCIGCISEQQDINVEAAHKRLTIPARRDDLIEVAVTHLQRVPNGVVSFGQGCEGEPLMQGPVLEATIRGIRSQTDKGVINLNSNASIPKVVARLADAGLDAIRISINSAQSHLYERYYRPSGYTLEDVLQSAKEMHRRSRFVSLNYFVFPGVTDSPAELDALSHFIDAGGVNMIQLRNLNIDPELYLQELGEDAVNSPIGIVPMIHTLRARFPKLRFGYFNPPKTRHYRPGPLPGAKLASIYAADDSSRPSV
ncbi:MAG TPA: radical SAM protein [Myxococcales bacterium]|nr:radical SAM protein [Myxococcales bacterium]HAN32767.1 radical SAM protein [Myxococcales bacterium]